MGLGHDCNSGVVVKNSPKIQFSDSLTSNFSSSKTENILLFNFHVTDGSVFLLFFALGQN